MPDTIGYEFQPGSPRDLKEINKPGGAGSPAGEVLRLLSLHMPRVLGGRPIAPQDLLGSNPGGGGGLSALLASLGLAGPSPVTPGSASPGGGPSPFGVPAESPLNVEQFGPSPSPTFTPGTGGGGAVIGEAPSIGKPPNEGPGVMIPQPSKVPTGAPYSGSEPTSSGYNHPLSTFLQHFFPGGKVG